MMKFATKFLSGLALAVALTNTGFANTYQLVDTYAYDVIKFDITLTTTSDASLTKQLVTGISGVINGLSILGLDNSPYVDNMFLFSADDNTLWFRGIDNGLSFKTAGASWVMFSPAPGMAPKLLNSDSSQQYGISGAAYAVDLNGNQTSPPGNLTSPVPEPEVYAMMLAGLGLVGFAARRKQKAVV